MRMYDAHGARVVHGVARPSSMRAIEIEIEIEIEIATYRPSRGEEDVSYVP